MKYNRIPPEAIHVEQVMAGLIVYGGVALFAALLGWVFWPWRVWR